MTKKGFNAEQIRLLKKWLSIVIAAEAVMAFSIDNLTAIYLFITAVFICGFLLRIIKKYPGKTEPLYLDLSAVIIALGYSYLSSLFQSASARVILIITSSTIILPHVYYILKNDLTS
jgi:hypothetical protein